MLGIVPLVMQDAKLVTLTQAAEWFPKRRGRLLSAKAMRRRIKVGERGVTLRATKDGGEWFTCREWCEEYQQQVTALSLSPKQIKSRIVPVKTPERVKSLLSRRFGIHGAK